LSPTCYPNSMTFNADQIRKQSRKMALGLARRIGESKVIDDPDILETVAGDESVCEPRMPDLLVRARTVEDIEAVLRAAEEFAVPVTPRGGGTGKAGGAIPIFGGVVLDTSRMNQLLHVDRSDFKAEVEPGIILQAFQEEVEREGLFYPPDPNSLETCCLGGNVAHNAGGPRAFKYGVTRNYVMAVEAVLMGGESVSFGRNTVKCVAGYDLTGLMVGSEGTLGVFSKLRLALIPNPPVVTTLLVLFPDEIAAGRAVAAIVEKGPRPRVMEFMDRELVGIVRHHVSMIPENTGAVLLVELDGEDETRVEADLDRLGDICDEENAADILLAKHGGDRDRLWAARRVLTDAVKSRARFKVAEDIAVPRSSAPKLLEALKRLSEADEVLIAAYGHAGDGNFHVNVLYDDDQWDCEPTIVRVFEIALSLGGTITGEHGVGIAKKKYLPLQKSPSQIAWMQRQKQLFDPQGLLNPGKIF
jgi:glycolate oxidase